MKNPHAVLGVAPDATPDEIKKAYRAAAFECHPDRNPGDSAAEARFKEISAAYEQCIDPKPKRRPQNAGPSYSQSAYADMFGSVHFGQQNAPNRGEDVHATVSITIEEAAGGCVKTITRDKRAVCPGCTGHGGKSLKKCDHCNGQGHRVVSQPPFVVQMGCGACQGAGDIVTGTCEDCHGDGLVGGDKSKLEVRIPAGINNGQGLRIANEGDPGRRADRRTPGDLYVQVEISKHPLFHLDGINLRVPGWLSYAELVLGCKLTVPCLFGAVVAIEVKPGTSPGATLRVQGQGFVSSQGKRGDLLITIKLECPRPDKVTPEHYKAARKLQAAEEKIGYTPERAAFGKLVEIRVAEGGIASPAG